MPAMDRDVPMLLTPQPCCFPPYYTAPVPGPSANVPEKGEACRQGSLDRVCGRFWGSAGQGPAPRMCVCEGRGNSAAHQHAGHVLGDPRSHRFPMVGAGFLKPLLCPASVLGTPFYLMEYCPGRVYKDPSLPGLEPSQRRAIYTAMNRVLCQIHSVDPEAVGLQDYGKQGKLGPLPPCLLGACSQDGGGLGREHTEGWLMRAGLSPLRGNPVEF